MNRAGLPLILAMAVGLMTPGPASSQGPVDWTLVPADGPAVVTGAERTSTAAERLMPAASTAALFSTMDAGAHLGETAVPFRQEVEIDDGDDDGVPFMIAGGIAFLAGAIVGDDAGTVLMLGGAGLGAYGAFVYFGGD